MDTTTLILEAKARFNHNATKAYLKEKYESKLIIAEQGGLWKADNITITLLSALTNEKVVLIDTFGNPVEVNRQELFESLSNTYNSVMQEWHAEWKNLEGNR